MVILAYRGVVRDTIPILNLDAHYHIFGTAVERVTEFYVLTEYFKCYPWDDRPPNGRGQGHVTRFFNLCLESYPWNW